MFGLQCVIVFLLVGTEAICTWEKDEDLQKFDGDQAEFDFDDPEDRDDQGTYLSDYWCYWWSLHVVLPVDDDSMVVDYGDEDEDLASYYLIIILIIYPCLGGGRLHAITGVSSTTLHVHKVGLTIVGWERMCC